MVDGLPLLIGQTAAAGRGVYAARALTSGEVVARERPLVSHPTLSNLGQVTTRPHPSHSQLGTPGHAMPFYLQRCWKPEARCGRHAGVGSGEGLRGGISAGAAPGIDREHHSCRGGGVPPHLAPAAI
jgi:hypothetical protein